MFQVEPFKWINPLERHGPTDPSFISNMHETMLHGVFEARWVYQQEPLHPCALVLFAEIKKSFVFRIRYTSVN